MKKMLTMLAAVAMCTGAALAQTGTVGTVTTTTVAGTAMTPTAPILTPMVSTASTTLVGACPTGVSAFPNPCAAKAVTDITGETVVLVLGAQEEYALDNLGVRGLNWDEVATTQISITPHRNPLTSSKPNMAITRHGNPYYPYIELGPIDRVAGIQEMFVNLPGNLTPEARDVLTSVANRYRGLTPQQAILMGYQPLAACIPNIGQVYVNQAAIDNRFDPMNPEAFAFDQRGRLLAAHYIVLSDLPVVAFGQPMAASPIVQGAQQLPVWLFTSNRNGMFAMQSTNRYCP